MRQVGQGWRWFRGRSRKFQIASWVVVILAVLIAIGSAGGSTSNTASTTTQGSTTQQSSTQAGSTGSTTPAPPLNQSAVVVRYIRSHRLADGHGGFYFVDPAKFADGKVKCSQASGTRYDCTYTVDGHKQSTVFTVSNGVVRPPAGLRPAALFTSVAPLKAMANNSPMSYRSGSCDSNTGICTVAVKANPSGILFGSEHEFVEPLFPIYKKVFAASPLVRLVKINVYGQTTNIGGKTSTNQVLATSCTRAANSQIDWDNLSMDGFHALCHEIELVQFSK